MLLLVLKLSELPKDFIVAKISKTLLCDILDVDHLRQIAIKIIIIFRDNIPNEITPRSWDFHCHHSCGDYMGKLYIGVEIFSAERHTIFLTFPIGHSSP